MKLVGLFWVICTGLVPLAASAGPYRCQVAGHTVYQDRPCDGAPGAKVDVSHAGTADPTSLGAIEGARAKAEFHRSIRVREAVEAGKVFIGMRPDEVVQSWGRPTSVNSTVTARGSSQQWVYRRGIKAQYVYLTDGLVTAIQSDGS